MFILPNYYDDWNKQWEKVSENLKNIAGQLNRFYLNDSFRSMQDMLIRFKRFNLVSNSIAFDKQMFDNIDFSQLLEISKQLKMISSVDISERTTALKQFNNIEILQEFKNLSIIFETYDFQKLARIMKDSFGQIDWLQDISVDEITEEVVEQYIEEELTEQADNIDSNIQNIQLDKEQIRKDIKGTISFWIGIVSLLLTIYGLVNSKPTVVYNTYKNTTEVSYNYTVNMGIDAEVMNNMGYRIINQNNVMPRIKPDCSSMVTGHLYIGQVVNVSDKYRKWIKITWKNEDGDFATGWIQNYKVSKFK